MKNQFEIPSYATVLVALLFASGTACADFSSGKDFYIQGEYENALKELKPLAEAGNMEAQNYLASMYADGKGVEKYKIIALFWYSKAAIQGSKEAQLKISEIYANGIGVDKNLTYAMYWRWKAAGSLESDVKNVLIEKLKSDYAATAHWEKNVDRTEGRMIAGACAVADYPAGALEAGQAGTVVLHFAIGAIGEIIDVSTVQSSGYIGLDHATETALKNCKFKPMTIHGIPVPSLVKMQYTWDKPPSKLVTRPIATSPDALNHP